MHRKGLLIVCCILSLAALCGCPEPQSDEPDNTSVSAIVVSPSCAVADPTESSQFSAATFNTAGQQIQGVAVTWSSSATTVAFINDSGLAQGVSGGNVSIEAGFGDIRGKALFSINPIASEHNCKPYEWYQTQMNTGYAQNNNCGPTSTYMAIMWYKNNTGTFPTVEEIRNRHPNGGGWWYTTDISESFDHYGIPFATHTVSNVDDFRTWLTNGRILLLCVEMKWITYNRHPFYDRFYAFGGGHFLIVKGWSENGEYVIVYDPNSWGNDYYDDGTMMGRNRFYKSSELFNACNFWWPYVFEIGVASSESTVSRDSLPVGYSGYRPAVRYRT